VAVLSGLPYLSPGHPTSPDVWSHLARQKIVYESLRDGYSPFWTFMFYSGYPHLRFYSPLFAFLSGGLALATRGNLALALKLLLLGLHLLSGFAMFLFLRRRTGSPWSACIGAAAYLLVPWRTLHIMVLANLPQALIYVLMPLMFWSFDAVVERSSFRHALLLGLWTSLAIASHLFSAGYVVLLLLVAPPFFLRTRRAFLLLLVSALAALLLSAWNLIPFIAEYSSHVYPLPDINLSLPRLPALLLPWAKSGGYVGGYLGLSIVLAMLGSLALLIRNRASRASGLAFGAMLVLVLILTFAVPAWRPTRLLLTAGLPGVRFLVLFVFVAATLTGLGWSAFDLRFRSRSLTLTLCALGVFVLISLDCLPHFARLRYSRELGFLEVREEAYRCVSEERPARVLDLYNHADRIDDFKRLACFPAIGYVFGNLPTVQGPAYYQFAPSSMRYVYPWTNFIARDLGTAADTITPGSLKALALLGVTHIITPPTVAGESLAFLKYGLVWEDRFLRAGLEPPLAYARFPVGLLLCSGTLLSAEPESLVLDRTLEIADDWRALLDAVDIDFSRRQMDFIPVLRSQPEELGTDPALHPEPSEVRNDRIRAAFETDADCFLRLAVSYYPELLVRLDGRPVPFGETKDHFVWLRCPAGRHDIEVTAPLTPVRVATLWLSGLGLAAIAVLFSLRLDSRPRTGTLAG